MEKKLSVILIITVILATTFSMCLTTSPNPTTTPTVTPTTVSVSLTPSSNPTTTPTNVPSIGGQVSPTHPFVLFNNINELPNYNGGSSDYDRSITDFADSELNYDFTTDPDGFVYSSIYAAYMGLAYQITKNSKYIQPARNALVNLKYPDSQDGSQYDYGYATLWYSLAYDWIQPALSQDDDTIARDRLGGLANKTYFESIISPNYAVWDDFQGRIYPGIAVAGMALRGYDSPYDSNVSAWLKCGSQYLWVKDDLHSYNQSLAGNEIDVSGFQLAGGYKEYTMDQQLYYAYAYDHYYGRDYVQDYPLAERWFMADTWITFPNGYRNDYCTLSAEAPAYIPAIYGLLNTSERSHLQYYGDLVAANNPSPISPSSRNLLPLTEGESVSVVGNVDMFYYLFDYPYPDNPSPSTTTTRLDPVAMFQVFRSDYCQLADWMSLVTFNNHTVNTNSNRINSHDDQLSVEIYNKGDLVLGDGGEPKYLESSESDPGIMYGQYGEFHNTLAVENPRQAFNLSSWAGSQARSPYKGDAAGIVTNVTITDTVTTPWMDAINTSMPISQLEGVGPISSTIQYTRQLLFPKDCEVIVDRASDSTEPWIFRTTWRPATFNTIATTSDHIGNANLTLNIGNTGKTYNWLAQTAAGDVDTGTVTGRLDWSAINPYGTSVSTTLYTAPAADVIVNKYYSRFAGNMGQSEVYSPVIQFKDRSSKDLYRVTIISTRNTTDANYEFSSPAVTGTGNAVKIVKDDETRYAYTGSGVSKFDGYTTDANTVYMRTNTTEKEITLIHGTALSMNGGIIKSSGMLDFLTMQQGQGTMAEINASGSYVVTITMPDKVTSVEADGTAYSAYSTNDNSVSLTLKPGDHIYSLM